MESVSFVFLFFWILDLVMFVQTRDSAHFSESLGFVIFFSCFLLFSSILFFIFWIQSYVYASVLSLSPSLGLYAAISCMPVVFLFVRFLLLFYTSIYPFSWS